MAFHSAGRRMSLQFVAHAVLTKYINIETKLGKGKQIKEHTAVGGMLVVHSDQYMNQWATSNCWPTSKRLTVGASELHAMQIVRWRLGSGDVLLLVTVTITEQYKTAMFLCLHVCSSMCIFLHAKNIIPPLVIHHVPISDSHLCFLNWDGLASGHLVWLRKSNTPCGLQIICQHNSLQLWS